MSGEYVEITPGSREVTGKPIRFVTMRQFKIVVFAFLVMSIIVVIGAFFLIDTQHELAQTQRSGRANRMADQARTDKEVAAIGSELHGLVQCIVSSKAPGSVLTCLTSFLAAHPELPAPAVPPSTTSPTPSATPTPSPTGSTTSFRTPPPGSSQSGTPPMPKPSSSPSFTRTPRPVPSPSTTTGTVLCVPPVIISPLWCATLPPLTEYDSTDVNLERSEK